MQNLTVFTILGSKLTPLGYSCVTFWGSWGTPGRPFWGSGGTPGRLWRAGGCKDPICILALPHFRGFWRPKGALKAPKMELKSIKNPSKNQSKILFDFLSSLGAILVDFGCQNEVKFGAKSNQTGGSTQKGRLRVYTVKTKDLLMLFGIQGSIFEPAIV